MGPRVSVRLPDDLLSAVDARAEAAGTSRAEAVRLLLRRGLALATDLGVDRTQIAHRLRLSPAERLEVAVEDARRLMALAGRAA